MDDNTKHIIASNLTTAYCANRTEPLSEKVIIEIYRRFVELLALPPGKFEVNPLNI